MSPIGTLLYWLAIDGSCSQHWYWVWFCLFFPPSVRQVCSCRGWKYGWRTNVLLLVLFFFLSLCVDWLPWRPATITTIITFFSDALSVWSSLTFKGSSLRRSLTLSSYMSSVFTCTHTKTSTRADQYTNLHTREFIFPIHDWSQMVAHVRL